MLHSHATTAENKAFSHSLFLRSNGHGIRTEARGGPAQTVPEGEKGKAGHETINTNKSRKKGPTHRASTVLTLHTISLVC